MTTPAQNSRQFLAQKGVAATPSYSFLGANTSGMYYTGSGVGISVSGTKIAEVTSTGLLVNGSLITATGGNIFLANSFGGF